MARKLSYKYEIEKQEKSLSQAKCPISLAVLLGSFSTVPLSLNCRSGKSFDAVESVTLFVVKCSTQMCHTDLVLNITWDKPGFDQSRMVFE